MRLTKTLVGAALALTLGACNQTTGQLSPTLQPGVLSPSNLAQAGLTPTQVTKVTTATAKVKAYLDTVGNLICPVVPVVESVANVLIAQQVQSPTGQTVKAAVTLTCQALASAPTYSSSAGGLVRATVDVAGQPVTVYGRRR